MKICSICNVEAGKYKCPICLIYYCSVACCNKHRATKCAVVEKIVDKVPKVAFSTPDTVAPENLEMLKGSEELKTILTNPHLRDLLKDVDSSDKPEEIMRKAMLEPIFVEFADACLKVIEPPET